MRLKLVLGSLLGGLLAAACGAAADDPTGGAPAVELGSSVDGYAPLADGGTILLYRGPQGGFHVFLGVRTKGIAPGAAGSLPRLCAEESPNPCVDFEVEDLDAGRVLDAYAALRVALTASATAPGSHELVPPRLVQLAIAGLDELDGRRLRITTRVEDRAGARAVAVVTVTCVAVR